VTPFLHQTAEERFQVWTEPANFSPMSARELLQNFRTMVRQSDINLAPVLGARFAYHQILLHRSINQTNCAVVSDLQLFR
jgi:hypothetical protein